MKCNLGSSEKYLSPIITSRSWSVVTTTSGQYYNLLPREGSELKKVVNVLFLRRGCAEDSRQAAVGLPLPLLVL